MSTAPVSTSSILILGANGRLGQAAVAAFAAAGWRVIAQSRRPLGYPLPSSASHTAVALEATDALAAVATGARSVLYAINPPYPLWASRALPLARLGMDVAARLQSRFLLPGNIYNFGAGMPAQLREDTPQQPSNSFGRIRCQLEDELRARAGLRSAVIRAGDFFGVGTGSWFDLVIAKSLRKGKLVYPGPLDRRHAWAYLPDLARAFVAVAGRDDLPAQTNVHFPGYALTGAELLDAIEAAAVELKLWPAGRYTRRGIPWPLLRVLGLFGPMWRGIVEMSYLWRVPHELESESLDALIGTDHRTALATALRQALYTNPVSV